MKQPKTSAPPSIADNIKLYFGSISPPIAWATFIYLLSAQEILPGLEASWKDFIFKKLAHMFVYGVLYFLIYRGVYIISKKHKVKNFNNKTWAISLIICLIYAITDELHQSTVAGRHGTLRDIGYDMIGTGIVILQKHNYI